MQRRLCRACGKVAKRLALTLLYSRAAIVDAVHVSAVEVWYTRVYCCLFVGMLSFLGDLSFFACLVTGRMVDVLPLLMLGCLSPLAPAVGPSDYLAEHHGISCPHFQIKIVHVFNLPLTCVVATVLMSRTSDVYHSIRHWGRMGSLRQLKTATFLHGKLTYGWPHHSINS